MGREQGVTMANAINDLSVKGNPLRVARTVDRDGERQEQEYERRNRSIRGEVGSIKNYLNLLEAYLTELGIGVPPSFITDDPREGTKYPEGELIESSYKLDRKTYIDRSDDKDMTFTDVNAGTLTLSQLSSTRGYTEDFTSATSFTVTHSLSSTSVIVQVYENDLLILPDMVTITDENTVTITVSVASAITVNIISIH